MKIVFATWLAGARLADIVLAATALELAGLTVWHACTRSGLSWQAATRMLLPGVFLTLALRVALVGGASSTVALCLLLAGAAHGVDLASRCKQVSAPADGR